MLEGGLEVAGPSDRVPGEGGATLLGEDLSKQNEGVGLTPGVLALRVLF